MVSHMSGGHLNPLATIAATVMRTISPYMFPLYIGSQLLGAIIGYGLLIVNNYFTILNDNNIKFFFLNPIQYYSVQGDSCQITKIIQALLCKIL